VEECVSNIDPFLRQDDSDDRMAGVDSAHPSFAYPSWPVQIAWILLFLLMIGLTIGMGPALGAISGVWGFPLCMRNEDPAQGRNDLPTSSSHGEPAVGV
jgi:hypothetical protein